MFSSAQKKRFTPYALIAPVCIFMVLVYGYPLFLTLKYSVHEVSLVSGETTFIGLANFKDALTDPRYYNALTLTFKWTVLTVSLKIGIGFIMALILQGELYFKRVLRFLMLIPWAIPQVVVAIIWSWILDGRYGYLNYYLQKLSLIDTGIAWLSKPQLAFLSTSFVDAWIGIPLITMIFLAGFHSIPESLYEAARIDGASRFQQFIYVTLPSMKNVIWIALLLTTIWTFNSFNVIFVLTNGGPMGATETLMIRIYKEIFGKYDLGMGATMAVTVFFILTLLSLIYWRQLEKGESS